LWIGLAAAVAWLFYGHGEHLLRLSPFLMDKPEQRGGSGHVH
jgi:hypothetical protein